MSLWARQRFARPSWGLHLHVKRRILCHKNGTSHAYELCSGVIKPIFFTALNSVEHKCRISFVERIPCTMRSNAASAAYELAAFEHDESTNTESDRSVAALLNFSQLVIFVATRSDPRVGFEKLRAHYFSGLSDELKGLYTKVETRYLASISSSTSSTAAGPGQPRAPNFANIISNVIGRMLHPGPSTSVSAATPRSQNEGSDPDLD